MNIAIVGGGAAGMVSAYLLDKHHQVTVFEKESILGGNIRTLNKNVTNVDLPANITVDNGVIEFLKDHSPHLNGLMADLGVELAYVPSVSSQYFLEDGRYLQAKRAMEDSASNIPNLLRRYAKLLPLFKDQLHLYRQSKAGNNHIFQGQPVAAVFGEGELYRWLKMLLMYSYSIPYAQIDQLPAELALGILQQAGTGARWNRMVGGVYTYIEKILERFSGKIHCGVTIASITRSVDGVQIKLQSDDVLDFDAVAFATPPDQVLKLLADPSEAEVRRFTVWQANIATTIIHTDMRMYEPYEVRHYTEFDVFAKSSGDDGGYNAYLNRLSGLPTDYPIHYNLAYNLADRIDPSQIIHRQDHHTPLYTHTAFQTRAEIIATNGEQRTYHAGAYLNNGLHEGAIASAVTVAQLLGGKTV